METKKKKTNREAHEEAAGYALDNLFFIYNGIDPDAFEDEVENETKEG